MKEANLFIGSHQTDVDRVVSVIEWWVEGKHVRRTGLRERFLIGSRGVPAIFCRTAPKVTLEGMLRRRTSSVLYAWVKKRGCWGSDITLLIFSWPNR